MEKLSQSGIIKENAFEQLGSKSCEKTKKRKRVIIFKKKTPNIVAEWGKRNKKTEDNPKIKNAVGENFLNDFKKFSSQREK